MNWPSRRFLGNLGRLHTDSWLSMEIYCDTVNVSPTGFPLSGTAVVHGGQWFKEDCPLCLGRLYLSGAAPAPEAAGGTGKAHTSAYEPCPGTCAIPQPFCSSMIHTKGKPFELVFFQLINFASLTISEIGECRRNPSAILLQWLHVL